MSISPDRRAALHAVLSADAEWQAFLRHFDLSRGFSFLLVLVDSRENAALCHEDLSQHLVELGLGPIHHLPANSPEAFQRLPALLRHLEFTRAPSAIWCEAVATEGDPQIEQWRRSWRICFSQLNQVRNILQRTIPCALVFVGAPWVQKAVREAAPDLWSLRASVSRIFLRTIDQNLVERDVVDTGVTPRASDIPDPEFALKMAEELHVSGGNAREEAKMLTIAGSALAMKEEFARAIPVLQRARMLLCQSPDDRRELAECEVWLGIAHRGLGQLAEAERLLRDALQKIEISETTPPSILAAALHNLAFIVGQTGRTDESVDLFNRAIALHIKNVGDNHPVVAGTWLNLGSLLYTQKRYSEAESAYRKALSIQGKSLGRMHPATADILSNLGLLFQATGRHHEAEAAFREALKIWEETLGPDDPRVDLGYYNLAVNLFQAGRIQEAERLARKAFEIEMRTGGPRAPIPYGAATILARILYALGRSQEAEAVALDSLERIVQLSRGSQLPESLVDLIRSGYLELFQQLGTNEQRYHNQLESISAGAARS